MKPKTMILMGLAITCGLGASYMTSRLLAERAPAEDEKIEILVAKRNLSVGERLTKPEDIFERKAISKDSIPPDAITDLEALKGKTMKQSRNKGEHVTPISLRADGDQLDIPDNHFAIGLRVNLEGSASGFATLPKSRVNIIQTVRGPDSNSSYAQVLLENVLVLAADLKLNSEGELAAPAQVITFALSGEDVLKVNVAKELGTLSLALRKYGENNSPTHWKVTGKDLQRSNKEEPKVAIETPVEPTPTTKIEPKEKPVVVVEKVEPKIVNGHYDIVSGTQSGPREVQRIHYVLNENGSIVIERTETIDSNTGRPQVPAGPPPRKAAPRDY